MSMSVDAKARDLTLKLDNSCNCSPSCCITATNSPREAQVYINSKGIVVPFDSTKGSPTQAVIRSISHIKLRVQEVAKREVHPDEKVSTEIDAVIDGSIAEQTPLTMDQVHRINQIVQTHLS